MIHPIETESYRILETRVDLSHLDPAPRAVVERVIHASADPEYATSTVVDVVAECCTGCLACVEICPRDAIEEVRA